MTSSYLTRTGSILIKFTELDTSLGRDGNKLSGICFYYRFRWIIQYSAVWLNSFASECAMPAKPSTNSQSSQGFERLRTTCVEIGSGCLAAIAFYTIIPVPYTEKMPFQLAARYLPVIGLGIGLILAGLDELFAGFGVSSLLRSAVLVFIWLGITGGLHLDGAMDTADGLAVQDPSRRLQVMADSLSGAFGVMVAIAILTLKILALADIETLRGWVFIITPAWSRWAQQIAILRYPYLKPSGKGAFHKQALPTGYWLIPGVLLLAGLSLAPWSMVPMPLAICLGGFCAAGAIALTVPAWFHQQLGGHTGDTYGAVVEWTETLILLLWVVLLAAGNG
jgi:adenosylcobinamide-GDP ribazoletransferase